jgi:hypothetical protein
MSDDSKKNLPNFPIRIGTITIIAEKLQKSLVKIIPKIRKGAKKIPHIRITISYDEQTKTIRIYESYFKTSEIEISTSCQWPEDIQIDGVQFKKIIDSYKSNDLLEINSSPDSIEIINGRSKFKMPRLDGANGQTIIPLPIPKNPLHTGKIEIKDEPFRGRVELDHTWDFSLRMPVPHHQYPESIMPKEKRDDKPKK